jgi:hypothetical protein
MRTALIVILLATTANATADSTGPAQTQDDGQHASHVIGLDATRIRTISVWPGKDVPCKLPKRDAPYVCHRLLEGPAIILSHLMGLELIVARGDQALASGARSWWLNTAQFGASLVPLALAPGEVLYLVGSPPLYLRDSDLVVTVYR